jgi:hypothetical protein
MRDSIAAFFQRLTQGAYVVGVAHGQTRNAFIAAWDVRRDWGARMARRRSFPTPLTLRDAASQPLTASAAFRSGTVAFCSRFLLANRQGLPTWSPSEAHHGQVDRRHGPA